MEKGKSKESYNISADNYIDNITIVEKILSKMDISSELIEFVDDRPGHDIRYGLDSSKIRNELNWSQSVDFDSGLEKTIDWYLKNNDWWKDISSKIFDSTPWKN